RHTPHRARVQAFGRRRGDHHHRHDEQLYHGVNLTPNRHSVARPTRLTPARQYGRKSSSVSGASCTTFVCCIWSIFWNTVSHAPAGDQRPSDFGPAETGNVPLGPHEWRRTFDGRDVGGQGHPM